MILLYRIFSTLLYPILIIFLFCRRILKKEDPIRFKEKIFISHFKVVDKDKSILIWFHAASIGEFKSIVPIIIQLNNNNQNLKFLITTTTLSSGKLAESELKKFKNVEHRYFPFDVSFLIDKFLYLWKPDRIFLVDSEIWPNLILKAKEHKIPIALINARLTSRSFKKWMMFPKIAKKIFGILNLYLCSNNETKIYLERLKLENIYFKGNIKLIEYIDENEIENINKNILLKKKFWFAASTHKGEDSFCLQTHLKLKEKFKNIITIIAPRHIERSKNIKSLAKKFNLRTQILNEGELIAEDKEIIIINYFGALKSYFKYAKSVFIGKSIVRKLKNEGGQNPIEAAKLRCKIYHGPYVYNFKEIYEILQKSLISKEIKDYKDLSNNLLLDLENNEKENEKILDKIKNFEQETLTNTMTIVQSFIKK
tara:strand:+ start:2632 stop:3906 length:1275 start_codon:yes stop_codon:yes gene_type:complete